jgi:PEP-CTERM motif
MTKNKMRQGLGAALVAGLLAAQPVMANTIELNSFWAGSGSASINFQGTNYHNGATVSVIEGGGSGGFRTNDLTTDPGRANSFQSWCVDIFHSFSFAISTVDVLQSAASVFGTSKADALGRLYGVAGSTVASHGTSAANSSAFQMAVWEIVNETAGNFYNISTGAFKVSVAQGWLDTLNATTGNGGYTANIWSVTGQGPSGWGAQDVAVFAPIPEPEMYLMMMAGLGLMGFVARRRQQALAA